MNGLICCALRQAALDGAQRRVEALQAASAAVTSISFWWAAKLNFCRKSVVTPTLLADLGDGGGVFHRLLGVLHGQGEGADAGRGGQADAAQGLEGAAEHAQAGRALFEHRQARGVEHLLEGLAEALAGQRAVSSTVLRHLLGAPFDLIGVAADLGHGLLEGPQHLGVVRRELQDEAWLSLASVVIEALRELGLQALADGGLDAAHHALLEGAVGGEPEGLGRDIGPPAVWPNST
jgi:hypothetical protein